MSAEPEPIGGEEDSVPQGGTMSQFDSLVRAPRALAGAVTDIRSIAAGMAVLPELARSLAKIGKGVESMDDEVARMRRGVDAVNAEVKGLRSDVDRLETHMSEMSTSLRPMRRFAGVFRRSGPATADPDAEPPSELS